ncbi:cupredoxin domain-containing protein [Methylobacterium sp. ID0610]|uniref:cupredoxin domain-containing protein n=1 Tax=Methylobacterium carpenticola TaxID=3344827 RepID=UPI003677C7EC
MISPFPRHRPPGRIPRAVAAVLLIGPAIAPSPARAAEPPAAEIRIDNFTFSPATITVAAGTQVTWINGDDIPHTVVADDRSFRSRTLDTEDRVSITFRTAGTYRYFCSLHPHMVGTVVVQAAPDAPAGPAP